MSQDFSRIFNAGRVRCCSHGGALSEAARFARQIMNRVFDPTLATVSRPPAGLTRPLAWLRRNRNRLALGMTTALIAGLILGGGFLLEQDRRSAQEELAENQTRQRREQREALLREIELLRRTPRTIRHLDHFGWSDQALRRMREAAALHPDDDLRDLAAAALVGWDARMLRRVAEFGASSIAFGDYLIMMGGLEDEEAKIWLAAGYGPWPSGKTGPGPVAVVPNRMALQLVATDGPAVALWEFRQKGSVRPYQFAEHPSPIVRVVRGGLDLPVLALASDASVIAAAGTTRDGNGVVAAWDRSAHRPRFQLAVRARALAFSPKHDVLAVGDEEGQVSLHAVGDGKRLRTIQADRCPVESLTFSVDGDRLAAGDAGGVVTAWDLKAGARLTTCRGGDAGIFALAFNLDGTLLAAGGPGSVRLWDIATGRQLLELRSEGVVAGLAFSPDGNRLVTCGTGRMARPEVHLWQLDNGRGIQTLPGLAAPVVLVRFSPDGKLLAALGRDGRVAIWDTGAGRFQRAFEGCPPAEAASASLIFSPDGSRLVLAAGRQAQVWQVASAKELDAWKLPPLPPRSRNALLYHSTGKLLLARVETEDGGSLPPTGQDFRARPRVCRIYELLSSHSVQPVIRIAEFNQQVDNIQAPMQGDCIVIEGVRDDPEGGSRGLKIFDALSGREIWAGPELMQRAGAVSRLDPAGKIMAYRLGDPGRAVAVEMPTGKPLQYLQAEPQAIGPDAVYWLAAGSAPGRGLMLYRQEESKPLVTLGLDLSITTPQPQFSPDGTRIAWGNADGSVCLCDIEEVRLRLNDIGRGW